MFQIIFVSFCVLILLLIINRKAGETKIFLSTIEADEDEILELPNEKAFYDETNKAIIDLKLKIDSSGITDEYSTEIKQLKNEILEKQKSWENIQNTLDIMIEERTDFVTQGNFYPKEYVFDINRLRTEKEKARDYQLNNPLKPLEHIKKFIDDQNQKITFYKDIKTKVESLLPKLEVYEQNLKTKKEQINYFNKKQELFLYIQNGNLKEAKELAKYFSSKTKSLK